MDIPVQEKQRNIASQGVTAWTESWDGPTVVLTVFCLLLTSMAGVGGKLLINSLNELRGSIQSLEERIDSRFQSLDEKVAANGERLVHIMNHVRIPQYRDIVRVADQADTNLDAAASIFKDPECALVFVAPSLPRLRMDRDWIGVLVGWVL